MEDPNGEVLLYCLGCGGPVCRASPGCTLAISCRCGAVAPLLYNLTARVTAVPASLVGRALAKGRTPPHLEYYLGYSDHDSPEKRNALELLLKTGHTSQAECAQRKCREAYQRGKAEWAERQERAQRSAQIGEP